MVVDEDEDGRCQQRRYYYFPIDMQAREASVLDFLHAVRPALDIKIKGLLNADPPLASTMAEVRTQTKSW